MKTPFGPEDEQKFSDALNEFEYKSLLNPKALSQLSDMELLRHLKAIRKEIDTLKGEPNDKHTQAYRTDLFTQIEKIASEFKNRKIDMPS